MVMMTMMTEAPTSASATVRQRLHARQAKLNRPHASGNLPEAETGEARDKVAAAS